jgi:hypothetical protein
MMGIDWRNVLPRVAYLAGMWLFWWLHHRLGWLISGAILAGLLTAILGATTAHCYLRLHRSGLTRRAAFRRCLSWVLD